MPRHFTVDEADGQLEWLEARFSLLEPYLKEVRSGQARSEELSGKERTNGSGHLQEELERVNQLIEQLHKSIRDILEQITERGIIVRDLDRGLVDFPAIRDGQEIYLCWVRGEPEVGFWHGTDTGFAGRQPL